jgi:hypothetical protein
MAKIYLEKNLHAKNVSMRKGVNGRFGISNSIQLWRNDGQYKHSNVVVQIVCQRIDQSMLDFYHPVEKSIFRNKK